MFGINEYFSWNLTSSPYQRILFQPTTALQHGHHKKKKQKKNQLLLVSSTSRPNLLCFGFDLTQSQSLKPISRNGYGPNCYMINKIIHGCLQIWNFSSRVQLDISLVRCAHSCAIEYPMYAPMYYSLSLYIYIYISFFSFVK